MTARNPFLVSKRACAIRNLSTKRRLGRFPTRFAPGVRTTDSKISGFVRPKGPNPRILHINDQLITF